MDEEYVKHETRNRQARANEYKKRKQGRLYGRIALGLFASFIGMVGCSLKSSGVFVPDPAYMAAKKAAKVKAAKAAKIEEAADKITSNFSPLNGRHYETCRQIKLRLHDPDSFKHARTRYGVQDGNVLKVYTTYYAKNAYGAKVITTHVSTVHMLTGNVLTLERYNGGR